MSQLRRVMKAAVGGLALALAVAAGGLLVSAALRLGVDCAGLSNEECNFETQMAKAIARQQSLAALGLGALAGGIAIGLRRRDRSMDTEGAPRA